MKRQFDSDWMGSFVDGAARVAFALTWANEYEERGNRIGPVDILGVAPETPLWAYVWAGIMIGHYEAANKTNIYAIAHMASEADGNEVDPEDFGGDLALMYLGTGVSWFDDHAKFALVIPHGEFNFDYDGE